MKNENVDQPIIDPMKDPVGQGEERKVSCDQALKEDGALQIREMEKQQLNLKHFIVIRYNAGSPYYFDLLI